MLLRARAVENQCFVAAAAQIGEPWPGRPSYGRSLIADPWGIVVAEAPDEQTVDRRGYRPRAAPGRARAAPVAGQSPGGRVPVVHPGLGWLEASPEGREWLARLPQLMRECEDAWGLSSAGPPFAYAFASLAYPVDADGMPAVLKLQFPDRESEHEADALEAWNGDGAVRLLARDDERRALLLERLEPGTPLTGHDGALEVILACFHASGCRPRSPCTRSPRRRRGGRSTLEREWDEAGRPCERRLLDAALRYCAELAPTQGEQVLLHQDLHPDNVLAAEREPWLVIDPKPLAASGSSPRRRSCARRSSGTTARGPPPLRPGHAASWASTASAPGDGRSRRASPGEQATARRAPRRRALAPGGGMTLRAVLFDVDFTLARPGPELGPEGYRRMGERFGLTLDPARYDDARAEARESCSTIPSCTTTPRSGSPSPPTSSAAWAAATRRPARPPSR